MASLIEIKRQKGTKYVIRYRLELHSPKYDKIYLPFGFTREQAEYYKKEIEARIAKHRSGLATFQNPLSESRTGMSISDFREWFMNNKVTAIRRGRPVSKLTMDMYDRSFRHLISWVGDLSVDQISSRIRILENALKDYKPSSAADYIRSLRSAWNFGIKRGVINSNPFLDIEISHQAALPDILTIDEKNRIYEKIEHPDARLAFALARYAGLRRQEIDSLRWDDIYWDQNLINIPKAKTGENQKVPIVPDLKKILLEHRGEGKIVNLHMHTITHYLTAARRAAGVNKKGSIHILRHSLGAELRAQGIDIRDIQDILRHTSISTTQIYTQLSKKALLEKIEEKSL